MESAIGRPDDKKQDKRNEQEVNESGEELTVTDRGPVYIEG